MTTKEFDTSNVTGIQFTKIIDYSKDKKHLLPTIDCAFVVLNHVQQQYDLANKQMADVRECNRNIL